MSRPGAPALTLSLAEEVARTFGTPAYVYDEQRLETTARGLASAFRQALDARLHYALKANSNPTLLGVIRAAGLHADAVSEGEVMTALRTGWSSREISLTAVNASDDELDRVHALGVPLVFDALDTLDRFGTRHPGVAVALRINPGVGDGHHPHVITGGPASKFGLVGDEWAKARRICENRGLTVRGLQQHIGSGILETEAMIAAVQLLLDAATEFPDLDFLDFGGGLGIPYRADDPSFPLEDFLGAFAPLVAAERARRAPRPLEVRFEPGRSVVGSCGSLLVRATSAKPREDRRIIGVDSGFSQLWRPMIYDAWHEIRNLSRPGAPLEPHDVAGNVCESGDLFARSRPLPRAEVGDLLLIEDAGAYGFSMASPYNTRGRPVEILVKTNGSLHQIRRRETIEDTWQGTAFASDPAVGDTEPRIP